MKQVITDPPDLPTGSAAGSSSGVQAGMPGTQTMNTEKWHRTEVVPQVSDTDYGGGIYHGKYFALYNQARDRFLADLGVSYLSLMNQGLNLSVAELHTRFFKPVFYGEEIHVLTRVSWLRTRSLGVIQKMIATDHETGETALKNQVELNLVCTNDKAEAVPFPKRLAEAIRGHYRV